MTEGFTGIDLDTAAMQIYAFDEAGKKVYNDVYEANKTFLEDVSKLWYSEKAVNFSQDQIPKLYKAQEDIRLEFNNSIVAAVEAYNQLASSNSAPLLEDLHEEEQFKDYSSNSSNSYFTEGKGFMNVGEDGTVGMKLASVQRCLDEYSNKIYQIIIPELQDVPYLIAFYDPTNEMKGAFKNRVNELVSQLDLTLTGVFDAISSILKEEMIIVEEAADAAASEMSRNNVTA